MSMQRRTFLRLSTVAAATVGGATLLGTGLAGAAPTWLLGTAPTTPFAVGVRQYSWTRGSRKINTYVYYPATG
ncbi:mucin, partial [Lentzea aerocolonigenes]